MIRLLSLIVHHAPWFCGVYLLGLAIVSLWPRSIGPRTPSAKEKSSRLLPQDGDNFKVVDATVVYRLEGGRRRPYKSAAAFLGRPENPPFGTTYEDGGILLCDSVALLFYPLGVKMPRPGEGRVVPFNKRPYKPLNKGRSLLRKDKVGHLVVYMGLAILLWLVFIQSFSISPVVVFGSVLFLGSLFGFFLELGQQYYSEGRDAEWEDMLMNVFGLLIGSLLSGRIFNIRPSGSL
ncbi:MAG: VanZ family protein [Aureispira sp.]